MTDAKRIAAYLNADDECRHPDWTAADVVSDIAIDGPRSEIARLMAMIADVRREEREACATMLDTESARELQGIERSHPLQTKLAMAIRGEAVANAAALLRAKGTE